MSKVSQANLIPMTSRLPFEPLRAFVHAADTGSFRAAARALNLTPSAVSQRIAVLERHLDILLFERKARNIQLTKSGHALLERLREPTAVIEHALSGSGPGRAKRKINLETIPSFASHWLVSRLGGFTAGHSSINVAVSTSTALTNLHRSEVDLAIRYGAGDYPGLVSKRLLQPQLVIAGSPQLISGHLPTAPADCLRFPLLQDGTLDEWQIWLHSHGLADEDIVWGPTFADDGLILNAACEGQGLAILRDFYAEEAIRQGRLHALFRNPIKPQYAYYLVATEETFRRPEIAHFTSWLFKEAAQQRYR